MTAAGRPMPRLLVVNQYFDGVEATGQVLADLCEDLARDLDVTVVAARPSGSPNGRWVDPSGVRVVWTRSTRFPRSSFPLRVANYLTFMVSMSMAVVRAGRPDVILCMTDPPVVGVVGALLARIRRAPLVLVCQDVYPEVGLVSGRLTNPLAVGILRAARRVVLGSADRVIAIGHSMRQRLIERGAPADRISVIPNWVDVSRIAPRPRDNAWAREHGLVGRFTVMHAGNVGFLQSLDTLLDVAASMRSVQFVIVGEGSGKPALEEQARREGLENVRFIGHQHNKLLPYVLASADVHIVSLVPGLAGFLEPSKIYGAMAAARPVIAAVDDDSEAAGLVRTAGCGLVVPPADSAALREALESMAGLTDDERRRLGAAARSLAERECARELATGSYRNLIEGLAAE